MRIVYFDCPSGASGDMILGALVDAGVSLEALRDAARHPAARRLDAVARAKCGGGRSARRRSTSSVEHVHGHHHHRTLGDVLAHPARRAARRRRRATAAERVFTRLADAEARVARHHARRRALPRRRAPSTRSSTSRARRSRSTLPRARPTVRASALPVGGGFVDGPHGGFPCPRRARRSCCADGR